MNESFLFFQTNNCLFMHKNPFERFIPGQKIKPATLACGGFGSPLALPATDFFVEAGASCRGIQSMSSCIAPTRQAIDSKRFFYHKQITCESVFGGPSTVGSRHP
jgi:hypothetical protein